jgi:hypothetical protein
MKERLQDGSEEQLAGENLLSGHNSEESIRYPAGLLYMSLVEVKLVGPTLDTSRPEDILIDAANSLSDG